jgi:hypothetical protein
VGNTADLRRQLPEQIRASVAKAQQGQGKPPAVIFDLDGTLSDNRERTFPILKLWMEQEPLTPQIRAKLEKLRVQDLPYGLKDLFLIAGLSESEADSALGSFRPFWHERFFSNDFIPFDRAFAGSIELVRQAMQAGATIIYMTGRDIGLKPGSLKDLQEEGFPLGKGTELILQKTRVPDAEYKERETRVLNEQYDIVATLDNEPANIMAFVRGAPEALHVFVATSSSDTPATPGTEKDCIYWFTWE